MRLVVAIAALTFSAAAGAHSLTSDLTVGNGYLGASLVGDLELRPLETYLVLGYSGVRPGAQTALSHQVSAGVDHAFGLHWLASLAGQWSPRSVNRVPLGGQTVLRASNASLGANATLAYQSAGFDFLEYVADVAVGATSYQLVRQFDGVLASRLERETLAVLRPSLGFTALFDLWTELSVRGSYFVYSEDPLIAGRFTEEQLRRAQAFFKPGPGQALLLQQALITADAVSGLQTAPVWFDLRASLSHRFSEALRVQLGWALIRYVPTQGRAHVPSVRAVWSVAEAVDLWGAAALQVDVPESAPRTSSLLVTLGAQVRFGDSVVDDENAD